MTVGVALRPFASSAPHDASAIVVSADATGGLRFERRRSMALASCLHRILRVGKTRQHRDTNAASLRTLLDHIETHTSAAVRARVEQGQTRLAGDRGQAFTVAERIARGSYVSAALLRQVDSLYQHALTQENALAIDRFLGVAPSPAEPAPWRVSATRPPTASCGLRRVLVQIAREGTMASEVDGIRIWAQPASDYASTWAHLRNAMAPGPCVDLSDDKLETQLAACDTLLQLPVKPARIRVLEVFHDAMDAVCSFFRAHDDNTSPQTLCDVRDRRQDLIHEKRRREFLGLLRAFLRAEVAAHTGSGSFVDDNTLARICASYLSRPAIFRSFVKAYNRHQVAMLVHGDSCPLAIAALVRQCGTAVDPHQRGGIDDSDLVALAEGLESWGPDKNGFAMLAEDGRCQPYSIQQICEAVAGALAGLVLPPPGTRPLKARMDELKTQPRELTPADFVRAAFPVLRPLLEERHRGALARRAAQIGLERSYSHRMRALVGVYPMLAPWAARCDPSVSAAAGDLLALDLVIPHILHPIVYAERLKIQEAEAESTEHAVKKLQETRKATLESYHATAAAESAAPGNHAPDRPQDRTEDEADDNNKANANAKSKANDKAEQDTAQRVCQIDLCIEAAQDTMLMQITARGRQRERQLYLMVEYGGVLWRACEVMQEYAELVGACEGRTGPDNGWPRRQPVRRTELEMLELQHRVALALTGLAPLAQTYAAAAGPQLNVLIAALRSIEPRLWLEGDGTSPGYGALLARPAAHISVWEQLVRPLLTGKRGALRAGMAALAVGTGRGVARAMRGGH